MSFETSQDLSSSIFSKEYSISVLVIVLFSPAFEINKSTACVNNLSISKLTSKFPESFKSLAKVLINRWLKLSMVSKLKLE